jgi:ribonuclease Z
MPELLILGTSNAIPDINHENTHMAVSGNGHTILVDCANNPIVHLQQAGLNIDQISDLILTHFHPDHVGGVPSLLMNSWLMGRTAPLTIYGLSHTLDRTESLMDAYEWKTWPNFFPVKFVRVPETEKFLLLEDEEFRIHSSPVCHMIPTIGLRIEAIQDGFVLAYSCDTEPCDTVVGLAYNADLLIHEATGEGLGHSSPAQAGKIAHDAQAKELMLIHFSAEGESRHEVLEEAQTTFHGKVRLAQDFEKISI